MCIDDRILHRLWKNFCVTGEVINMDARKTIITFEPLEVIASIMPWNFPYWQRQIC